MAVYGLGVSGLSALAYLQDIAVSSLLIVDGRPFNSWSDKAKDIVQSLKDKEIAVSPKQQDEADVRELFGEQDLIILSPGIARESKVLEVAIEKNVEVLNELEVGYRILKKSMSNGEAPKVLALTGTNGKTTCVTFLGEVLKEAGLNTFVGGNIGTPLHEALRGYDKSPYDIYLFEVSSFQCESMGEFRPQVGGILNLAANHGERYDSVEAYRQAKWLLAKAQTREDVFLVGDGVNEANFNVDSQVKRVEDIAEATLKDCFDLRELKLVGSHNRWNLGFCWLFLKSACETLNLNEENMKTSFQSVLNRFTGVEHRLEFVGEYHNVEVYNDAKSTNWLATLTAIEAVKERELPVTLIIGGQLRGNNDEPPEEIQASLNSLKVLTIGESGSFLKSKNYDFEYLESLENLIDKFFSENSTNKEKQLLLFSPAFPSFDQFKNYVARGKSFKELIQKS